MSVFLGKSFHHCHGDSEILAVKAAPGGFIVGCLSRHNISHALEFSLWVAMSGAVEHVKSLTLFMEGAEIERRCDITWHSSGNSVYILTGIKLLWVKVEWGDLYQDNRHASLSEFYSLFLCEQHKDREEGGRSWRVTLRLIRVVGGVTARSLHMSLDSSWFLFCSPTSPSTTCITVASLDLKHMRQFYFPAPAHYCMLTADVACTVHMSPLELAAPAVERDGYGVSAAGTSYQLCCDRNSLDIALGFSDNCIFLLHPHGPDFMASSYIRVSVSAATKGSSACGGCANDEEEEEEGEEEEEEGEEGDHDDYDDDNYDVVDNEGEGEADGEESSVLDRETHGLGALSGLDGGRICDVACLEAPFELLPPSPRVPKREPGVFYVVLLEHQDESHCSASASASASVSSIDSSFELVCIHVTCPALDDFNEAAAGSAYAYSCRVISRFPLRDEVATSAPAAAACSSESSAAHGQGRGRAGPVREDSSHRLQFIRSDSRTPSGLLVHMNHSIQCVGICCLGLVAAETDAVLANEGVAPSTAAVFRSVLFALDLQQVTRLAPSRVCCTVAASQLLVTTSWRTATISLASSSSPRGVPSRTDHSYMHSVSLLLAQPRLSECPTAFKSAISNTLLDVSEGIFMVMRSDTFRTQKDTNADRQRSLQKESDGLPGTEVDVFPSSGQEPFLRAAVPPSLLRDMTMNRCKVNISAKAAVVSAGAGMDGILTRVSRRERLSRELCGASGGLISALVECPHLDSSSHRRGYIASAVSITPSSAALCDIESSSSPRKQQDVHSNPSLVWIQSTVTARWKILRIPDGPAIASISLLPYTRQSLTVSASPGKLCTSRKLYAESRNKLVGLLNIGWFEDHTVVMCTVRTPQLSTTTGGINSTHCCLEVMSRASEKTQSVTVEHNREGSGRRDLRRLSTPNVHKVVPLPAGFIPVFVDFVTLDGGGVHAPSEERKSRSASIASVGTDADTDYSNQMAGSAGSACVVLLGNITGHFIALQVVATLSSSTPSTAGNSHTPNATAFKPVKYRVTLVWQCDLPSPLSASLSSLSPRHSSHSRALSLSMPLRSAQLLVTEGAEDAASKHPDDVGMLLLDRDGKVVKVSVALCPAAVVGWGACLNHKGRAEEEELQTRSDFGHHISAAFVTSGECTSVLRVREQPLNTFLLTSASCEDVLYLAMSHSSEGVQEDRSIQCAVREPTHSVPLDCMGAELDLSSLCYSSPVRMLSAPQLNTPHVSQPQVETYNSSGEQNDHNNMTLFQQGVFCGPSLALSSSLLSLSLVLGLLNMRPLPPSPLGNAMLVLPYRDLHTAVPLIGNLISSLRLRNAHTCLLQLADEIESYMKSIIERPRFTRHSHDFAILTTALFAADDFFFIDMFSKLARKLEPHVSVALFPLPNCQISYVMHSELRSGAAENETEDEHQAKSKYDDSCWNQLSLFELCLDRRWLSHASMLLTIACEYVGGSQCIETLTACLVLATELLLESLRHMSLQAALECVDFCVRLDMMAVELIARADVSCIAARRQGTSRRSQVAGLMQREILGMMNMLSPLLGHDLHDVIEDALQPHNARNATGLRIYNKLLYAHPKLKYRLHMSGDMPKHFKFKSSSHDYFAFCAANIAIEERIRSDETEKVLGKEREDNANLHDVMERVSPVSYTCTTIQQVVAQLVRRQKWVCAAVTMSSLQQRVLASSRDRVSWVENSLYYKGRIMAISSPCDYVLLHLLRRIGLSLDLQLCPSRALADDENDDLREFLAQDQPTSWLQSKCEEEMIDDCGSLSTMSSADLLEMKEDSPITTLTPAGHCVASKSLFSLPEENPGFISMVNLLQGAACAALLTGHVHVILFISVILCKAELARACLLGADGSAANRDCVTDFFLSRVGRGAESRASNIGHEGAEGGDGEVQLSAAAQALLKRLFGSSADQKKLHSVQMIHDEILRYFR